MFINSFRFTQFNTQMNEQTEAMCGQMAHHIHFFSISILTLLESSPRAERK